MTCIEKKRTQVIESLDELKESGWAYTVPEKNICTYTKKYFNATIPENKANRITCSIANKVSTLEEAIIASGSCMWRFDQPERKNRAFYKKCMNEQETVYLLVSKQQKLYGYGRFFLMGATKNTKQHHLALYLDHEQLQWENYLKNLDFTVALAQSGKVLAKKIGLVHLYADGNDFLCMPQIYLRLKKHGGVAHLKRNLMANYQNLDLRCVEL